MKLVLVGILASFAAACGQSYQLASEQRDAIQAGTSPGPSVQPGPSPSPSPSPSPTPAPGVWQAGCFSPPPPNECNGSMVLGGACLQPAECIKHATSECFICQ